MIVSLLLLHVCSDKYRSLVDMVPVPQLRFDTDTIAIREKDYSHVASSLNPFLKLYAVPSPPQMNIQSSDSSQKLRFMYRGTVLEAGKGIIVAGDSTILFCACDTEGFYAVDFYLTDHLGKTDERKPMVRCVKNERPKAGLVVSLVDSSQPDNWICRFDGSGFIKQYGIITSYNFNINGREILSNLPFIEYTFHQRCEHTIKLYVKDDLGEHSDTLTTKILIPRNCY